MNTVKVRARCHFVDSVVGSVSRRSVLRVSQETAERLAVLSLVELLEDSQPSDAAPPDQPVAIPVAAEAAPAPAAKRKR
jgi:hypothetical protein